MRSCAFKSDLKLEFMGVPKRFDERSGKIEEQETVPNFCPEPAEREAWPVLTPLLCSSFGAYGEIFRSPELEKQALSKVTICEVPASDNLVLLWTEKFENWNNLVISSDPSFSTW